MADFTEITSTEKLLDIIRKKGVPAAPDSPGSARKTRAPHKPFFHKLRLPDVKLSYWHSNPTVGVDLSHNSLRMVKTRNGSDGKKKIIDHRIVPYPDGINKEAPEFTDFLKRNLSSFCASSKFVHIWSLISAVHADIRHILIPKVTKKQLPHVIQFTAKKELSFDEKEQMFDYEVQGEVYHQGIVKLAVIVYIVPRLEIEATRRLFDKAGWPLSGITIIPFAVQNILRTKWLMPEVERMATIFIGNNFSRIDIYAQQDLVMTRNIKAGTSSLVEAVMEGYTEKGHLSDQVSAKGDNINSPLSFEEAREIMVGIISQEEPLSENTSGHLIKKDQVISTIMPALDRLIRQIQRTFEHFMQITGQDKIEKVYCSSVISLPMPVLNYISEQIGIEVELFDPFTSDIPQREVALVPISERVNLTAALGLSLSENSHTPNLIFTYKDKLEIEQVARINKIIFITFIATVIICTSIFLSLKHSRATIGVTVNQLETELSRYQPPIDEKLLLSQLERLTKLRDKAISYGKRHHQLALISELTHLTPPAIRLINVKINLRDGPPAATQGQGAGTAASPAGTSGDAASNGQGHGHVILEGVVRSDIKDLDAALAEYALKLDTSPLFTKVTIEKSTEELFNKKRMLQFIINMSLQ